MKWLSVIPALFGAASLAFNFVGNARDHEILHRRFCDLLGDIYSSENVNKDFYAWQKKVYQIHGDEPPTYRALDAWAHNIVCHGRGQEEYCLYIKKWDILLKNLWPFWDKKYKMKKDKNDEEEDIG